MTLSSYRLTFLAPYFVETQRQSFLTLLNTGLINELSKRNPIFHPYKRIQLFFYPEYYQLSTPKYTPKQAILKSTTYGAKLYVPLQIKNLEKKKNQFTLQWVEIGSLPLMTKRGHFIVNGCTRVVVNQLVRSPGVYYQQLIDLKRRKTLYVDLVPDRGTWLRIHIDRKKRIWVRMKKVRKIPLLVFLEATGITNKIIHKSIKYPEFVEYSTWKTLELKSYEEFYPRNMEEGLLDLYSLTSLPQKYDDTLTLDLAKKFLFRKFFNYQTYDLSYLGRFRLNKKFHLSTSPTKLVLTQQDILVALDYLIQLDYGIGVLDDIDHLQNRRVRTSGELIQNQLGTGFIRLEKFLREKIKNPNVSIFKVISPKPVNGALREFFGSSPLSQFMDETNPLAELTHKRRVSSLGPGGITRETAGMAIRGIHPTHYGRVCPIETPEGKNAGLVNSLTTFARVNSQGFIETPFYPVYQGQIQKTARVYFISAEQEQEIVSAPGDLKLNYFYHLPSTSIPVRAKGDFKKLFRNQVEYMSIGPIQMISVATSLIPFLEHDDANRALMGSNMQRQAVPLVLPEKSIVGTGFESRVITDSGHGIQAKTRGFVSYASSKQITITNFSPILKNKTSISSKKKFSILSKLQKRHISFCGLEKKFPFSEDTLYPEKSFNTNFLYFSKLIFPKKTSLYAKKTEVNKWVGFSKIYSFQSSLYFAPYFGNQIKFNTRETGRSFNAFFSFNFSKIFFSLVSRTTTVPPEFQQPSKISYSLLSNIGITINSTCDSIISYYYDFFWNNTHKIKKFHTILDFQPQSNLCFLPKKLLIREKHNSKLHFFCLSKNFLKHYFFISKNIDNSHITFLKTSLIHFIYVICTPIYDGNKVETCIKFPLSSEATLARNRNFVKISQILQTLTTQFQLSSHISSEKNWALNYRKKKLLFFFNSPTWTTICTENFRKIQQNKKSDDFSPISPYTRNSINQVQTASSFQKFPNQKSIITLNTNKMEKVFTVQKYKHKVLLTRTFLPLKNFFITKKNKQIILRRNKNGKYQNFHDLKTSTKFQLYLNQKVFKTKNISKKKAEKILINLYEKSNTSIKNRYFSSEKNLYPIQTDCIIQNFQPFQESFFFHQNMNYKIQPYHRSNQNTCMYQRPLVHEGEWVQKGQLLADGAASVGGEVALGKTILVAYMPWEGYNFEDAILVSQRLISDDLYTSIHIERYEIVAIDTPLGKERITRKNTDFYSSKSFNFNSKRSHLDSRGIVKLGSWVDQGDILVGKITPIEKKKLSGYERLICDVLKKPRPLAIRDTSLRVPKNVRGRVIHIELFDSENNSLDFSCKHPQRIHVYIAEKRKIQVGDKMSGRHGNKGIISKILPRQDMPYLPDGTPVDMVLNPLGVPSRMNVGQIFECLLGLAGKELNEQFKIKCFDEIHGPEASRSFTYSKLFQARLKTGKKWLFNPNFPGKMKLFDGRTGECFHQTITVGQSYMLKLVHLVDEKIHARSTGPYSLVTQQPLRGRSKHGGQRLGEMEVWALEGFGAAYTLQELLTVKSDDLKGRHQVMQSILQKKPITLGTPESFKVLLSELQSLCLNIEVYSIANSGVRKQIDILKFA